MAWTEMNCHDSEPLLRSQISENSCHSEHINYSYENRRDVCQNMAFWYPVLLQSWHLDISFKLSMKSSDFAVIAKCHLCLTLDMRLTSFENARCGMTFRNVTWHVWKHCNPFIHIFIYLAHYTALNSTSSPLSFSMPVGLTLTWGIYLRTFMTYF